METKKESGKKEKVEQMFNAISGRYDLLNTILSFGVASRWKRKLIKSIVAQNPKSLLDVATGTGDIAIAAAKNTQAQIVAVDIAQKMMDVAKTKIAGSHLSERITFIVADGENLPFKDNTFEAVTIAYGIRNFENPKSGIQEFYRVLKPNGTIHILEFSLPSSIFLRRLYKFYFMRILPAIGKAVSKHPFAYNYLPCSVDEFPFGKQFVDIMQQQGFKSVQLSPLTGGIATLYCGTKQYCAKKHNINQLNICSLRISP